MQSYHSHDSHQRPSVFDATDMVRPRSVQTAALATRSRPNARRSVTHHALTREPLPSSLSSATLPIPRVPPRSEANDRSSSTWTTSSGDPDALEDADASGDRVLFVEEYNRLARKVRWRCYPA